jgi:hypothetical protein
MRAAVKRGITYGLMMTAGILLAVGVWRTEGVRGPAANTTGRVSTASIDEEILAQMKDLFGAQLNGVVEYAGESPDIQLSESAAGEAEGQAQPVVIELRRGGEIVRTLGFSDRSRGCDSDRQPLLLDTPAPGWRTPRIPGCGKSADPLMKTMRLLLAMWLCGAGGWRAWGADAPTVTVQCLGRGGAEARPVSEPLYLEVGAPIEFDINVTAPLGTHMTLWADLIQRTSGSLAAPLLKDCQVSPRLDFDDRTQMTARCKILCPSKLARPARLLVKLYARIDGQTGGSRAVATLDVFEYPERRDAEWQGIFADLLAQGGMAHMLVFGKNQELRRFLSNRRIPFENYNNVDWPDTMTPDTLYVGDGPPVQPEDGPSVTGKHVVLFLTGTPAGPGLPGVYSAADGAGGAVVKVILPEFMNRLNDNRRIQENLVEILRGASNPKGEPRNAAQPQ